MTIARGEVRRILRRLLSGGPLDSLPKRDADRQILLALGAWQIHEAGMTGEQAVSERLHLWLSRFCLTVSLDQVTFRRALVDAGYMGRTHDGSRYWINSQAVLRILAPDALDTSPGEIMARAAQERDERKQRYLAGLASEEHHQ